MVEPYTALAIQRGSISPKPDATESDVKENIKKNIEHIASMLKWAMHLYDEIIPAKLVALPEATLGQNPQGNTDLSRRYGMQIPGEETDIIGELAKKYEIYIVGNGSERDPKYSKINNIHWLNTNFLINPHGKVILKYRKINPWIPLEQATSPHDFLDKYEEPLFPVADTEIGKLGTYVCYDQFHPEVARELTVNGAEVHIKPTSFCSPWQSPPMDLFQLFNRSRSAENLAYGIYPNVISRGAGYLGGGSMIVDYFGRPMATAPVGESETVIGAIINIDELRKVRESKLHNSPKHIRAEAYSYLKKPILAPNKLLI